MKKLTTIITGLLIALVSLQSQASLINFTTDQASYGVGDTVLIDITLEDLSLDTAILGFELNFDNTAISYNSFNFSDDVLNSTFFAYADLFVDGVVTYSVNWLSSLFLPATDFSLGQVSFTALQAYTPEFDITGAYVGNDSGTALATPSVSTPVPEPSAALIILFSLIILPLKKKLLAKRN